MCYDILFKKCGRRIYLDLCMFWGDECAGRIEQIHPSTVHLDVFHANLEFFMKINSFDHLASHV